jgi:hypothetical protein
MIEKKEENQDPDLIVLIKIQNKIKMSRKDYNFSFH